MDEAHDVVVIEPEVVPEVEPAQVRSEPALVEVTVESPTDNEQVHSAGGQCLPCRWATFKPVPVTEGPFAGKAFYFGTNQQAMPDVTHAEP